MMKTRSNARYYRRYTLVFCLMTLVLMSIFIYYGKSTVTNGDGVAQHYTALAYYGRWLRQILKNIFVNHSFSIPEWNFSIGLGSNVLTTLNYYCIGDPLAVLSAAVPASYTEYLYDFLCILRLYLAGLTFSMYCLRMKKDPSGTLAGAVSYVFCGYAMFVCFRQPFFINPMIYLPLMLIGVEKILAKERPYLFLLMVFISLISNFYFFYMLVIGTVLYAVVRYFTLDREKSLKDFILTALPFLLYGGIGAAMGCVLLIPVLKVLLSGMRATAGSHYNPLYSFKYYEGLFGGLISTDVVGNWKTYTTIGISAPAMIAIFALFGKKKERGALKFSVILLSVLLLIPFFGSALNGFSYVCNRWVFLLLALTSFILATVWPDLMELDTRQKKSLLWGTGIYVLILLIISFLNDGVSTNAWVSAGCILAGVIVLLMKDTIVSLGKDGRRWVALGLGVILTLNLLMNWQFKYGMDKQNYISYYNDIGAAYGKKTRSVDQIVAGLGDDSGFFRYDDDNLETSRKNGAMLMDTHGVQFYWSMASGEMSQYLQDMSLNAFCANDFDGFNGRTALDALAGVKYYLSADEGEIAPYGYEKIKTKTAGDGITYNVFENQNPLPFGFAYSGVMYHTTYDALDALGKQEAMLQGALVENSRIGSAGRLPEAEVQTTARNVDYTITCGSGAYELPDGSILTTSARRTVTLKVSGADVAGTELYLTLNGVKIQLYSARDFYKDEDAAGFYSEETWADLTWGEKISLALDAATVEPVDNAAVRLSVKCGTVVQEAIWRNSLDALYTGRDECVFNMGYREDDGDLSIVITLPSAGRYSFDRMDVFAQPMETYQTAVSDLASRPLENVQIGEDTITGSIQLEGESERRGDGDHAGERDVFRHCAAGRFEHDRTDLRHARLPSGRADLHCRRPRVCLCDRLDGIPPQKSEKTGRGR